MKNLPFKLKIYVIFIIFIGMVTFYLGITETTTDIIPDLIFFAFLSVVAEAMKIKVSQVVSISVNFGIGLAAVLVFKSPVTALIGFASMLFAIETIEGKTKHLFNTPFYKRLFNGSTYAISLFISSYLYSLSDIYFDQIRFQNLNLIGIIVAILTYAIVDTVLFVYLFSILKNQTFLATLHESSWSVITINFIAISPLGILIALLYGKYGMFSVIMFFGPLLLARFSFKLFVDMKTMYSQTITALSNAVDAKDQYTNGHSYRVADYGVEIAKYMNFKEQQIQRIKTAATLHDIGKIGVLDSILNKPGKLEPEEFDEIKKHPLIGAKILSEVTNLVEESRIIKYHHERYDGTGYPEGLSGDQVPIESYIISVSDAFDAMTSDRPYRKALDRQTAINIICEESGKQFHPLVVEAFKKYINKS